jgi:hypothetical protein
MENRNHKYYNFSIYKYSNNITNPKKICSYIIYLHQNYNCGHFYFLRNEEYSTPMLVIWGEKDVRYWYGVYMSVLIRYQIIIWCRNFVFSFWIIIYLCGYHVQCRYWLLYTRVSFYELYVYVSSFMIKLWKSNINSYPFGLTPNKIYSWMNLAVQQAVEVKFRVILDYGL